MEKFWSYCTPLVCICCGQRSKSVEILVGHEGHPLQPADKSRVLWVLLSASNCWNPCKLFLTSTTRFWSVLHDVWDVIYAEGSTPISKEEWQKDWQSSSPLVGHGALQWQHTLYAIHHGHNTIFSYCRFLSILIFFVTVAFIKQGLWAPSYRIIIDNFIRTVTPML